MENHFGPYCGHIFGHLALCAVLVVGFTLNTTAVEAQEPTKEELQEFRSHLEEGGELLKAEKYEQAIDELERARAIVDHPKISLSIANAYRKSDQCKEAREEYDALSKRGDIDDEMSSKIASGISKLEACKARQDSKMAEVEPEPDPEPEPQLDQATTDVEPTGDPGWVSYVSWGAIGLGAGLAVGGVVNDFGSLSRTEELAEAQSAGDTERIAALEDEASRATTRSAILYTSGAVLLTTGVVLKLINFGPERTMPSARKAGPTVEAGVTPTGVTTVIRW